MFTTMNMHLLFTILIYIPTICIPADLKWFGFRTANNGGAETNGFITITLWYNLSIYECTVQPTNQDTTYGCFSNQWVLTGTSECSSPEYKMMIANSFSDNAVWIVSVILQDIDDTWWSSDSWCIADGDTGKGYSDAAGTWKLNDDTPCGWLGLLHGNWNILCVDNEGRNDAGGCWPQKQIVSFDITRTNLITYAVIWENGEGISVDPKTCNPTSAPTKSPSKSPTPNTDNPTLAPSQPSAAPSVTPTAPTNIPTNQPTIPSIPPTHIPSGSPTNMPTNQPTHCTQDSNAIWKVSFDFTLKKNTSTEMIKENLNKAATEFITTNIASSTDCNVATYTISIDVENNSLEQARINASVCFNCEDGVILNVNLTQAQLKRYFIETVNNENTVLSVNAINYITVDVLHQIITTTMNAIVTTIPTKNRKKTNKQKWIGSMNFTESILLLIGLAVVLILIIVFLLLLIKRKRKKMQQELDSKNLVQMSKLTTDKPEKTEKVDIQQEGVKQENIQDDDNEDLYGCSDENIETKTKQDTLDNSSSDSDDLFGTNHVTSVETTSN